MAPPHTHPVVPSPTMSAVIPDGRSCVFTFADKTVDETYGELFCTLLRRDTARIERASHMTDYDGFRIEVVTTTTSATKSSSSVQHFLKDACDTRAAQVSTMLASLSDETPSASLSSTDM